MAGRNTNARPIDMVWSLAVILVPLVIIAALFTRDPSPDDVVQRVDYAGLLESAQAEAPYPLLAPRSLPDSWVATKAVWTRPGQAEIGGDVSPGYHWALGYLSPDRVYVSLDQRDTAGERLVNEVCRGGSEGQASQIGPRTWRHLGIASKEGRRCLVASEGGVVTVVAGEMSFAGLEAFASTLA